jgi:hypothetical protein
MGESIKTADRSSSWVGNVYYVTASFGGRLGVVRALEVKLAEYPRGVRSPRADAPKRERRSTNLRYIRCPCEGIVGRSARIASSTCLALDFVHVSVRCAPAGQTWDAPKVKTLKSNES